MTNEEKQALIEHIQIQLDLLRNVTMRYADECEIVDIEQDIKVQEIALAALTAQPVKLPDVCGYEHPEKEAPFYTLNKDEVVAAIREAGYEVQE